MYFCTDIAANECGSNPCQNGGACADDLNTYVCTCRAGFTGVNCQIGKVAALPCGHVSRLHTMILR